MFPKRIDERQGEELRWLEFRDGKPVYQVRGRTRNSDASACHVQTGDVYAARTALAGKPVTAAIVARQGTNAKLCKFDPTY